MKRFPITFVIATALVAALLLLAPRSSRAQYGLRQVPIGFCTSSSLGSAAGLSSFTGVGCTTAATLQSATYAVICAYSQGIVWRDDGTAPTSIPGSGGQGLAANQCFGYSGTMTAIQFIQQTATATVGVTLYR